MGVLQLVLRLCRVRNEGRDGMTKPPPPVRFGKSYSPPQNLHSHPLTTPLHLQFFSQISASLLSLPTTPRHHSPQGTPPPPRPPLRITNTTSTTTTTTMISTYLTSISAKFNPFARAQRMPRIFLSLLPPNARNSIKISIAQFPQSSEEKALLNLTFSTYFIPSS